MIAVITDTMERHGRIEYRTQDDYLRIREAKKVKANKYIETKYKIEIDSLKEGLRVIIRNRVVKEWIQVRHQQYESAKNTKKPKDISTIDMKMIEFEVDQTVIEAFDETIVFIQEEYEKQRAKKQKQDLLLNDMKPGENKDQGEKKEEEKDKAKEEEPAANSQEGNPLTFKARAQREGLTLQRQKSIMLYQRSETNLAP